MKTPEKQFWTYIALLSGVMLLGLSGQLISCARAEGTPPPRTYPADGATNPDAAPWNTVEFEAPPISKRSGVNVDAQLDRSSVLYQGSGIVHVEVRVDTKDGEPSDAAAQSDIVVVVDTSGSMEGEKIDYAKQALYELLQHLKKKDRFALVEYSSQARTLVPLQYATANAKLRFQRAVRTLTATGSTNMSAGLDLGAQMLLREKDYQSSAGRLVLLSDGLANAGDSSHLGLRLRAQRLSEQGIAVSTMGIGADFDESLMTQLATAGTGAFYYLARLEFLPEFLEAELSSTRRTYAHSAQIHLRTSAGIQLVDAMGLKVSQYGASQTIQLGNLYSGRTRSIWLTLRVPTHRVGTLDLGALSLSFRRGDREQRIQVGRLPRVACLNDRHEYERHVNKDVWERALLNNVFTKTEEDFGDAIRSGDRQVIRRALEEAEKERALAKKLGSKKVISKLDALKSEAAQAERAQRAPAPVRNARAKKAKARGFQKRHSSSYGDLSKAMQAY